MVRYVVLEPPPPLMYAVTFYLAPYPLSALLNETFDSFFGVRKIYFTRVCPSSLPLSLTATTPQPNFIWFVDGRL